jgi:hypothetical protein
LGHPRYNALTSFVWLAIRVPLMIFSIEYWQNCVAASRLFGSHTVPFVFLRGKTVFGAFHGVSGEIVVDNRSGGRL